VGGGRRRTEAFYCPYCVWPSGQLSTSPAPPFLPVLAHARGVLQPLCGVYTSFFASKNCLRCLSWKYPVMTRINACAPRGVFESRAQAQAHTHMIKHGKARPSGRETRTSLPARRPPRQIPGPSTQAHVEQWERAPSIPDSQKRRAGSVGKQPRTPAGQPSAWRCTDLPNGPPQDSDVGALADFAKCCFARLNVCVRVCAHSQIEASTWLWSINSGRSRVWKPMCDWGFARLHRETAALSGSKSKGLTRW